VPALNPAGSAVTVRAGSAVVLNGPVDETLSQVLLPLPVLTFAT
jgi:hypothetical protein